MSNFSNVSGNYWNTYSVYTAIILASDISSLVIRLLLCIGMLRCQHKCHPFDVSCLVLANLAYNYGILSWVAESIVKNTAGGFSVVCYLINARQIAWLLCSHSLVFLSFNCVYMIHVSLFKPTHKIQSTAGHRWTFSIAFHTVHLILLLLFHILGYVTDAVAYYNYRECSKSTTSDAYVQINYIMRNLIPCLAIAINYVIIVPAYMIWHLRQSQAKNLTSNDAEKRRVNKVMKLSFFHFIYTFFQASSWLISTGVTEFVLKKDSATSSSSPHAITMFEMFFGTLNNDALVGVWWLEVISWMYMLLDSFNPLILIFLHKHLKHAIIEMFVDWKNFMLR